MFDRSAGSLALALPVLLLAAASAGAARAPRIWFRLDRLPLVHATKLGLASGTPVLTPLMKLVDHDNAAPIQKQ
jgi:hypothetical protein